MNRKSIAAIALLVLAALAAGAATYASPWWSVHQMRKAAAERDADALLARVDQAALRQSVRLSLGFELTAAIHEAAGEKGRQAEGASELVRMQLDPMTDTLTSAPLLMAMLIQGHPSPALGRGAALGVPRIAPSSEEGGWDAEVRYVDRSTVQVRAKNSPLAGGFILKRKGWLNWKLSGLQLPGQ